MSKIQRKEPEASKACLACLQIVLEYSSCQQQPNNVTVGSKLLNSIKEPIETMLGVFTASTTEDRMKVLPLALRTVQQVMHVSVDMNTCKLRHPGIVAAIVHSLERILSSFNTNSSTSTGTDSSMELQIDDDGKRALSQCLLFVIGVLEASKLRVDDAQMGSATYVT